MEDDIVFWKFNSWRHHELVESGRVRSVHRKWTCGPP